MFYSIATIYGQETWDKFEAIKNEKSSDVGELALQITSAYEDELDKIKAIYYWVAHNIRYDYGIVEQRQKEGTKTTRLTHAEYEKKRNGEIATAIKRKKGVCQHYALVFEELCLRTGIEVAFIGGFAKTMQGRKRSHAWNAVKYKNEWQLIDVTYGSGRLDDKNKFVAIFDPNYFFAEKDAFILNHFPKESKWQLQKDKIEEQEFISYLGIGKAFMEYNIKSLDNKTYIIKVKKGEDIVLKFKADKPIEQLTCYRPASLKRVAFKLEEKDLNYKFKIDKEDIRPGHHLMTIGDYVLFSYKFVKL